jgi:hypothetical protein
LFFLKKKKSNIPIKWHFKLNCIEIQNEYVAVYFAKVKQLGCSFKFIFPKEKKNELIESKGILDHIVSKNSKS